MSNTRPELLATNGRRRPGFHPLRAVCPRAVGGGVVTRIGRGAPTVDRGGCCEAGSSILAPSRSADNAPGRNAPGQKALGRNAPQSGRAAGGAGGAGASDRVSAARLAAARPTPLAAVPDFARPLVSEIPFLRRAVRRWHRD